jgi:pimeloyl-ACP methyl ester carboxylesterase
MHCNRRGKGDAVLFIHGMPTNGRIWDDVVRDLACHFRCFIVDLPGMGGTPFLSYRDSYFERVAAQIEDLRIRYRVQRWHIVAHDGGCAMAVHYAHLFPKRVGCLGLLSPAIFPDLQPFFLLEILRKPILGEILAPLVHALFWHVAMRRAIPADRNKPQRVSFSENFSGMAGPWRLMRLVRWGKPGIMLRDFPCILRTLNCPTLVLHGSRDVLPESFARRAADLIKNARLITLDSGHFIPLDQANRVARNLLAYFSSRGSVHAEEYSPNHGEASCNWIANPKVTRRPVDLVPLPAAQ